MEGGDAGCTPVMSARPAWSDWDYVGTALTAPALHTQPETEHIDEYLVTPPLNVTTSIHVKLFQFPFYLERSSSNEKINPVFIVYMSCTCTCICVISEFDKCVNFTLDQFYRLDSVRALSSSDSVYF